LGWLYAAAHYMRAPLSLFPLIPAKAGTQVFSESPALDEQNAWVPAFAGMSGSKSIVQS
jgi:hypothetical protein